MHARIFPANCDPTTWTMESMVDINCDQQPVMFGCFISSMQVPVITEVLWFDISISRSFFFETFGCRLYLFYLQRKQLLFCFIETLLIMFLS